MNQPARFRTLVSTAGTTADILSILKNLNGAGLSDILAVRAIIEPEAAAAAVSSATGADIDAIVAAHEQASLQTGLEGFEMWDTEFHRLIYAATRNQLLISLHDILKGSRARPSWIALKGKVFTEQKRRDYCRHHGEVAECIRNRNSQGAAQAMVVHINTIRDNLFGRSI